MSKKKEKHYNNTIPGYQVDTGWSGDGGTRHLSMSSKQTRRVKPFDRAALSASATPPAHEVLGKCEMHGPSHRPLDSPTWHVPAAAGDHSYVPFFVARGWEERCRVRFSTPHMLSWTTYIHCMYAMPWGSGSSLGGLYYKPRTSRTIAEAVNFRRGREKRPRYCLGERHQPYGISSSAACMICLNATPSIGKRVSADPPF
jgi:hypothetical protein